MASLYPKKIGGTDVLVTCARWAASTASRQMISERYLGTAADIAAAMETREAAALPERTRHLAFGDVAAAWGILEDLGVAAVIDEVTGSRPAGAALSAGTYLALAALNRLVAPCSKAGVRGLVEDHRRRPAGQDPGPGAGSPVLLGRDARRHPGAAGGDLLARSRCGSWACPGWTCRRSRWT